MLKLIKNTILDAQTVVDDVVIAQYHAEISSENPNAVQIQTWQFDVDKCVENRALVSAEQAQFEDAVCELKKQLIAETE